MGTAAEMGQIFSNLTKQGVMDPASGSVNFDQPAPGTLAAAKPMQVGTPPVLNPQTVQPTVQQAASVGAGPGGVNAASPGLTKAGKLAVLLTSGIQGALAGRAAQEEATIQSGGRRSGGAGIGFQAGYALPWQRAQEQAQAQLAQAGVQPVNVPGVGQVPAALAPKFLTPYFGYEGKLGAAQIGAGARTEAAQTAAGARVQGAQIGAGARTEAAKIGADARVRAAELGLGPIAQVPDDLQQQFGLPPELPLRMLNQAESAANKPLTVVQGAAGPALVNKQTKEASSLGLGSPGVASRLAAPREIADPDNPGQTKIVSGGTAIAQGAAGPQSASVQVPLAAAKAEVPTKIGDQKVAFETAIQHADLLRRAAKALDNGDVKVLADLKNDFKDAFGYSGPVTSQAIADAYGDEVSFMLSKGHMTDAQIGKTNKTIDPHRQNYATIDSVLGAYQSLAQSKLKQLNQQKQSAINQSQAQGNTPPPGARIRDYTQLSK